MASKELSGAQAQLDEKQAELDKVQAMYDAAMAEKQVHDYWRFFCGSFNICLYDFVQGECYSRVGCSYGLGSTRRCRVV